MKKKKHLIAIKYVITQLIMTIIKKKKNNIPIFLENVFLGQLKIFTLN